MTSTLAWQRCALARYDRPVGRLREIVASFEWARAKGDHARVDLFGKEIRELVATNRHDVEFVEVAMHVTAGIVDPTELYAGARDWPEMTINTHQGE